MAKPVCAGRAPIYETGYAGADSGLFASARFVRGRWPILLLISAVLLLPCYWHKHIEAGDLGSHMYNAWLVQLIDHGRAPGLRVENMWQHILFDRMVSGLGFIFGLRVAEKIAVSLAVLLFFWSLFVFVCVVSRSVPWTLLPAFAMLTYGWTFHIGLFNYYLSIGFSFLGLAIVWGERGWKRLFALALTPLMFLAHPLGLMWFFGAALYILIAGRLPPRAHAFLPAITGLLLVLAHKFMWSHLRVAGPIRRIYAINGVDQVVVYGNRYRFLAGAVFVFVIACLVYDAMQRSNEKRYWSRLSLPVQLYIVAEMGVLLLPSVVYLPKYAAPLELLVERLSLVSAVLVLGFLGILRQRTWHRIGFGVFACIYFSFLYQDTARIDSMETQVERLVSKLPPGTRVMATILRPRTAPFYVLDHIVDRACIERCFSYGNYEPPSGEFRVRAWPGNGIVTASVEESQEIEMGTYLVKLQDLPAFQIYQCTPFITDLCMRKLEEGERNDRLGVHPGQGSN